MIEIKTSMLLNLDYADNTILSCFVFVFLITDLYVFIPEVIAQIFNPISELVIQKAEIEIYQVIAEARIRKFSKYFRVAQTIFSFYLSIHFALFLQRNNFLFHLFFLM